MIRLSRLLWYSASFSTVCTVADTRAAAGVAASRTVNGTAAKLRPRTAGCPADSAPARRRRPTLAAAGRSIRVTPERSSVRSSSSGLRRIVSWPVCKAASATDDLRHVELLSIVLVTLRVTRAPPHAERARSHDTAAA